MRANLDTSIERHRRVIITEAGGVGDLERQDWLDTSPAGRLRVVDATAQWLRRERERGLAGNPFYSLAKHRAVYAAWEVEKKLWAEEGGR